MNWAKVDLTEEDIQTIVGALDLAVKHNGIRVVKPVATVLELLEQAQQDIEKEKAKDVKTSND